MLDGDVVMTSRAEHLERDGRGSALKLGRSSQLFDLLLYIGHRRHEFIDKPTVEGNAT